MPARRCSFWEHGRQCRAAGRGNPPLCPRHEFGEEDEEAYFDEDGDDDIAAAVVDRIMDHPAAREVFGRVSSVIDSFANVIDQMSGTVPPTPPFVRATPRAKPRPSAPPPPPPRARQAPPPPPPPRPVRKGPDPRAVLGIPASAQLTRRLIKDRQRALAMKHHPDRGGSTEKMQRINEAAAELLKHAVG